MRQGVFGSAAGLSGAVGKGLAQLTFDGGYKRARARADLHRPAHAGQGVWQGGRALGAGVVQGVTGVVAQVVTVVIDAHIKCTVQVAFHQVAFHQRDKVSASPKPKKINFWLIKKYVFLQPIRGYAREGARGALKGLGKGLVGAVVKPAAGLADLVAQVLLSATRQSIIIFKTFLLLFKSRKNFVKISLDT